MPDSLKPTLLYFIPFSSFRAFNSLFATKALRKKGFREIIVEEFTLKIEILTTPDELFTPSYESNTP
ncbi:hypothetical protein MSG34_16280 [Vibrio sp. 1CM2L]|uniref:hypothetical protein n=1 Tax=Vibrio sp. 1CM2L TaxID=2929166 RepID=UPI0020C109E7|nr:hypothetical protein [Vibrio sp. 1CM2L]MCK8077722.1 hypothetical protein [Vibrio sp. 1CM2L]